MRAGEPFGAPEGVRLKRYSRSEIDIPNGRSATLWKALVAASSVIVKTNGSFATLIKI